jgi:hypothetical protein
VARFLREVHACPNIALALVLYVRLYNMHVEVALHLLGGVYGKRVLKVKLHLDYKGGRARYAL